MRKNKTLIKICGIKKIEDALLAASAGADILGFIFYPKSPRYVLPPEAKKIIQSLPKCILTTGVFINYPIEEIKQIVDLCGLDLIQLHGEETPQYAEKLRKMLKGKKIIKAFRIKNEKDLNKINSFFKPIRTIDYVLLDTYVKNIPGGTGKTFDWKIAAEAGRSYRIILSGGLNDKNIEYAIRTVNPAIIDVASGVERKDGSKDPKKMETFISKANLALEN